MEYSHTQWGNLWAPSLLLMAGVVLVVAAAGAGEPVVLVPLAVFSTLILGVLLAFSRLTVSIAAGRITTAFAWGWPRRTFALEDVVTMKAVRNKWWYGWGIRKIPGGWMFNVWGLDAVELELISGKKFRVGTDAPDDLVAALSLYTALRPPPPR
ncbi:MAG: hypothetical protein ACE5GC_08015 [Acidimicrobiia bacterium]